MSLIKIYAAAEARDTILRRVPWEDQAMPARVLDGIERIFGERLAPAEAVARILRDVRERGDAALREWSARIDGAPPPPQLWGESVPPGVAASSPPDWGGAASSGVGRPGPASSPQDWAGAASSGVERPGPASSPPNWGGAASSGVGRSGPASSPPDWGGAASSGVGRPGPASSPPDWGGAAPSGVGRPGPASSPQDWAGAAPSGVGRPGPASSPPDWAGAASSGVERPGPASSPPNWGGAASSGVGRSGPASSPPNWGGAASSGVGRPGPASSPPNWGGAASSGVGRSGPASSPQDWGDRGAFPSLEIPSAAWRAAYDRLPDDQRVALDLAADRIATFHRKQPMDSWVDAGPDGTLGQLIRPLDRVGVYVPGGTAALPSSLLMAAIPARVAGVGQVIVCTPPGNPVSPRSETRFLGETGFPDIPELILAAAYRAGVDRLFALGGAQAIAAMAYGTESVPAVDKIVGAGGLFITLAKRQVIGRVGIDGFYGPTETLLIADEAADPAWAAADLLAQAEHDVLASPLLLTPSRALAEAVAAQLACQLPGLSRAEIAAASLADRGGIVLTADLAEAVELANAYAPEHLCLLVRDPWALVGQIRHAGGIFVGEYSFEVLGDYIAGPSHVMPTEGSARYASPLSVADFVKRISLIALNADAGARLAASAAVLARGEGLTAHAAAAGMREVDKG